LGGYSKSKGDGSAVNRRDMLAIGRVGRAKKLLQSGVSDFGKYGKKNGKKDQKGGNYEDRE